MAKICLRIMTLLWGIIALLALTGCDGGGGDDNADRDAQVGASCEQNIDFNRTVAGSGPPFFLNFGLAVEADGQIVVADDRAVLRVDPTTGARTIISDANTGSGPAFTHLNGIAVEADGQLVVTDLGPFDLREGLIGVLRVDPVSGNRSVVSSVRRLVEPVTDNISLVPERGSGPVFVDPLGIAVEADGQLVVTNFGRSAVLRVDPLSGDRTVVSGPGAGTGLALGRPFDIAVEADGQLVVTDPFLGAVLRVDPDTGDRTPVSFDLIGVGAGPALMLPLHIVVDGNGRLVVDDIALEAVLRIDPDTGNRTTILDTSGELFPPILGGLAVEADGHLLLSANGGGGSFSAIQRLCSATNNLILVSGSRPDEPDAWDPGEPEAGFKGIDPRVDPEIQ